MHFWSLFCPQFILLLNRICWEYFKPYQEKWAQISQDPRFHGGGKSQEYSSQNDVFIAVDENYNNPAYFKVILGANTVYSSGGKRETLSQRKENVWEHKP